MKLLCALLLSMPVIASAATYVSTAGSTLEFSGAYDGDRFDGRFRQFSATLEHDAANPGATKITAQVDMASADTANEERDATLVGDEFFATAKHPTASFEATNCSGAAPNFTCQGRLTIRGKSQAIPFLITLTPDGNGFRLAAKTTIRRSTFDVGTGDWADTDMIADDVEVRVAVTFAPK